jgi:site-specific recombinase XerD
MNGEFYTEDQIRGLLDDCSPRWPTGIRDRALISLIYGCGARISEALALDVPDLRPGRKVHIACGRAGSLGPSAALTARSMTSAVGCRSGTG